MTYRCDRSSCRWAERGRSARTRRWTDRWASRGGVQSKCWAMTAVKLRTGTSNLRRICCCDVTNSKILSWLVAWWNWWQLTIAKYTHTLVFWNTTLGPLNWLTSNVISQTVLTDKLRASRGTVGRGWRRYCTWIGESWNTREDVAILIDGNTLTSRCHDARKVHGWHLWLKKEFNS